VIALQPSDRQANQRLGQLRLAWVYRAAISRDYRMHKRGLTSWAAWPTVQHVQTDSGLGGSTTDTGRIFQPKD
jgi:hypothetical protein